MASSQEYASKCFCKCSFKNTKNKNRVYKTLKEILIRDLRNIKCKKEVIIDNDELEVLSLISSLKTIHQIIAVKKIHNIIAQMSVFYNKNNVILNCAFDCF